MRRIAAAGAALAIGATLFVGCVGQDLNRPVATAVTTPHLEEDAFVAADGARLPLRSWVPEEGPVKAAVVAVHGFNDYSNAFTGPASEWAKAGIATYAYDQRGFGKAPETGMWAGVGQLDVDLWSVSRLVKEKHPGVPLYLLGESMGGAVVITAVTGAAGAPRPDAAGIILVAPAVWGRPTMNVFERAALWVGYEVAPGLTLTGRQLHIMPSDNIPMLRAFSADPLVIKETRIDTVKGLVDLMDLALAVAPRLDVPMMLLYGEHDQVIPPEPIRLMIEHLPQRGAAKRRIAWYADGYHMLLRDLEAPLVMRDVEAWIADPRAPLPSGADRRATTALVAKN